MTNNKIINTTKKGVMSMTNKNTNRIYNWEIKQLYRESDRAYGCKKPNRKRLIRFGGTKLDKLMNKYGFENHLFEFVEEI